MYLSIKKDMIFYNHNNSLNIHIYYSLPCVLMLQVTIKIERFIITNLVKIKTTGIIRNIYGFMLLNQIKFTYKNNK